jgi:hypothetical protein
MARAKGKGKRKGREATSPKKTPSRRSASKYPYTRSPSKSASSKNKEVPASTENTLLNTPPHPLPQSLPFQPPKTNESFYAARFPDGPGYFYIKNMIEGANSDASLVLGVGDSLTYMRQAVRDNGLAEYLPPLEVHFVILLKDSGFVPKALVFTPPDEDAEEKMTSIIIKYCNGRDMEGYLANHASDENVEVLIWYAIATVIRVFAYLLTGNRPLYNANDSGHISQTGKSKT